MMLDALTPPLSRSDLVLIRRAAIAGWIESADQQHRIVDVVRQTIESDVRPSVKSSARKSLEALKASWGAQNQQDGAS